MIIRCPQCEHTRSISESKIPATAELATCPKCKHRFRFRTLRPQEERQPEEPLASSRRPAPEKAAVMPDIPQPEVIRPQEAFREAAAQNDIWDAVDALHQRWESQMDQHVTEVVTPRPSVPQPEERTPPVSEAEAVAASAVAEAPPSRPSSAAAPAPEPPHAADTFADALTAGLSVPEAATVPDFMAESAAGEQPAADEPAFMPEDPPTAKAPAVFLYAGDGPDPEERVAHDIQMLRDTSATRPTRDLGRLREFAEGDEGASGDTEEKPEPMNGSVQGDAIPWEQPEKAGWLKSFMATLRGTMFGGPAFFSGFTPDGSLTPGYLFFLIMGYVSILGSLAWSRAVEAFVPGVLPLPASQSVLPTLLLAPIALGLMLLFLTGWVRLVLRVLAPASADFVLIYKVAAYASAPFVLSVVPFVGPPLGALWFMACLVLGCRYTLGVSRVLSVLAPVPPALLLLAGIVWFFL